MTQSEVIIKPITTNIPKSIEDLPDIVLGAGVFNYQYTDDPHGLSAENVLRKAFDLGIRALDTSAYYGPSEEIVGKALKSMASEYPRDTYLICTKAGRVAENNFDYSAASIRSSVLRSLERLNTTYLDVLYIHDVEFVETKQCLEAIDEAFALKKAGYIKNVGISGYPLDFLLYLATLAKNTLSHGSLDIILSYSNFCMQNTLLEDYVTKFKTEAGVRVVLNASPLSMSLLRAVPPHPFHPASLELRKAVSEASVYTSQHGVDISDLAVRFVYTHWTHGPTVFGLQTVREVETAVQQYWQAKTAAQSKEDEVLLKGVREILGSTLNQTWPSGIEHPDMTA
ncbi:D-arabinose 1-dehydrogenase (NAD(P)(+)) ARA2 [Sugiyamaella lignohabitans]|uniref:D-arabinose 1-dehydrogenase (NAD(P)(+)) ARA2 n=1 Tax=Sugiyamaella lignohabitans TaxID=796027 RepID=A0A167EW31_9ASCO|nr:D-arabinose 1-dehydrogenase (NAD(P)(+)) ARA2 [Sugiyamaella lignohabitans]ANB14532.1 D-arabinose 1-dehydrogenase (NAD(P)(+)) ARA2 [Sugiyamaella lignohabitans]